MTRTRVLLLALLVSPHAMAAQAIVREWPLHGHDAGGQRHSPLTQVDTLSVQRLVPKLIARDGVDLVVANAENVANGMGVTPETADELLAAEVDLLTSGNHIWSKREIVPYLERPGSRLLPPRVRRSRSSPSRSCARLPT